MARSKKSNMFAKTRKVLNKTINSTLNVLEGLYRKGSNSVLGIASKGLSELKTKSSRKRIKKSKR